MTYNTEILNLNLPLDLVGGKSSMRHTSLYSDTRMQEMSGEAFCLPKSLRADCEHDLGV